MIFYLYFHSLQCTVQLGSGKTTQVPQFILEECSQKNKHCRIVLTQPRRIAATSIAKRIADERNDTVGNSVGYQIRLDSCVSPRTNLIVTTRFLFNPTLSIFHFTKINR